MTSKVMQPEVLRIPDVRSLTGLSRSSIYVFINQGTFPRPFNLGPKAIGFLRSEIEDWIAARVAASREPAEPLRGVGPRKR